MLDQPRSTQRYQLRRVDDEPRLLREMRSLARQRPRFGADRIDRWLVKRHWHVNHKRVHRLWQQENMQVPRTQHRRRRFSGGSENSRVRHRAEHKDHVWSYDFVSDRTEDGRQLRLLVVVDEYTRECLALEVARSFTSQDVLGVLQYLFAVRGRPEHIRSRPTLRVGARGPEFTAGKVREWLTKVGVKTLFSEPGSPRENGYVESAGGRLRDELLAREQFDTLLEAKVLIERWRRHYNTVRPHGSLGYRPPAPDARPATSLRSAYASTK